MKFFPGHSHLRVMGCLAYIAKLPKSTDKLDATGVKCILLGYPIGKKGFRVYDMGHNKIIET